MVQYSLNLKMVAWLSIRDNVIENQIRGYLGDTRVLMRARMDALVASAPSAAQAIIVGEFFRLKVTSAEAGIWELYPKMVITVSVSDNITRAQVRNFLEDYWDQFKVDLRTMVANAPGGANAQITEWHVHRLSGSVDEVE